MKQYGYLLYILLFCLPRLYAGETEFERLRMLSADELRVPEDLCFFASAQKPARGLVIAVHGLNVKPSVMGSPNDEGTLVKLFVDSGFHTARITLRGHDGPIEDMQTVSEAQWLADAYIQYIGACRKVLQLEGRALPVYLAGFSLGALVFETLANEECAVPVRFEKAVLFAPALAIKTEAHSLLLLDPLLKDTSIINSRSPQPYRAQRGASLGAYKALFTLEKRLHAQRFARNNIPTLVIMDPRDEFISIKNVRKTIKQYALNWNIQEISATGSAGQPLYHHLIIDECSAGYAAWTALCASVISFLEAP